MRYVPNAANLVRTATIAATAIVPSSAIEPLPAAAEGGGSVELSGPYTGQADTVIDVEFVDTVLDGAPRVSAPSFVGVGNGELTDIDPGTLAPQVFTLTCIDLGTETRFAIARFCGVRLVAHTAGAGGNALVLRVDDSALVATPSEYSTTQPISAGAVDLLGDAFDFGHPALTADGNVPANAPRVRFGADPVVYRLWKRWRGDAWAYNLSPPPVRDIPAGVPVLSVAGTYSISVTDGVTQRDYTGVQSVYDALFSLVADPSGLVSPVDPVVVDRSPAGMATLDVFERTAPFVAVETRSGSAFARAAELAYQPALSAPGEQVTVECVDNTVPGAERWAVRGTVTGRLADAITGVLYSAPTLGTFRVPTAIAPTPGNTSRVSFTVQPTTRSDTEPAPCINLSRLVLGARARTREITYTLTRRPPEACDCTEQPIEGGPNPECLGLDPELGDADVDLHPLLETRQGRIADWLAGVAERRGGAVDGDRLVPIAEAVAADLSRHLARLSSGQPLRSAWAASTQITGGAVRRPTVPNGFIYRWISVANATTGTTEPTWPTTLGGTVVDGGVTWTCWRRDTVTELDSVLSRIEGEWRMFDLALHAASALPWQPSTRYGLSPVFSTQFTEFAPCFVAPSVANGRLYYALGAAGVDLQASGATEPTWPNTDYATVVDGGVTWMALPRYWTASQQVSKDTVRVIGFGLVARALVGGTTGSTEPSWVPRNRVLYDVGGQHALAGREVSDGGVTWRLEVATPQEKPPRWKPLADVSSVNIPPNPQFNEDWALAPGPINLEQYLTTVRSLLGPAYISAGLRPFDFASAQGARCWRDIGATEWWVPSDPTMLPAFTGVYYHSVRRFRRPSGEEVIEDTQEFGFGIQACGQKPGDSFTVRIESVGSNGGETYQPGDRITLDVIRAVPVAFGGGQTGDDQLTWSVVGSVAGALPNHVIDRNAVAPYSAGGLKFNLSLGSVPYALGDRFRFEIEGGRWRWRRDGGAWSSPAAIGANLPLADGLAVTFRGGGAPSFVAGDRWSWRAVAINGPGQLRSPTPGRLATSGATTITLGAVSGAVRTAIIADHAIPQAATLTLQASALADFSVLQYSAVIPWRRGDIVHELPASVTAANWRLVVSAACEIGWLALGEPLTLSTARGAKNLGEAVRRLSFPSLSARVRTAVDVSHEMLSHDSVEALRAALEHAVEHDDRLLGVLIGDAHHIVRLADEPIEVTDQFQHQPRDPDKGLYALSLTLEAA